MTCDKWDDMSSSIEACIADVSIWMNNNMIKFNKDKTEAIVFLSKQHVGSTYINYFMSVRNIGLILDNTIGMEKQVNYIYISLVTII